MHRNITYRLIPGTRFKARRLSATAGACRWVWNWALAVNRLRYKRFLTEQRLMLRGAQPAGCGTAAMQDAVRKGATHLRPPVTFFSLGKAFTRIRRQVPWLQALPFAPVRHVLKYQADAFKRAFADPNAGFPQFKAQRGDDSFTIPQDVKIRNDSITGIARLWVPKIGWCILKRSGGNPYQGCEPVQAVIKRGLGRSPHRGRWYCTVCYNVGDRPVTDNGLIVGIDRNIGQVAIADGSVLDEHDAGAESPMVRLREQAQAAGIRVMQDREGLILHAPEVERLEARKRHYQRMMARRKKGSNRHAVARHRCARTSRRLAMARDNWHHKVSRAIADGYGTVCVEALNTRAMTSSAKGTAMNHGRKVKAKAGLNRSILATGWAGLREKLAYKVAGVIEVRAAYTSQRCSTCGHVAKENRRTQSRFKCVSCGYQGNADINAALNILALGTGVSGRGARAGPAHSKPSIDRPNLAAAALSR